MPTPSILLRRWSTGLLILALSAGSALAQIPGKVTTTVRNYRSDGMTDQHLRLGTGQRAPHGFQYPAAAAGHHQQGQRAHDGAVRLRGQHQSRRNGQNLRPVCGGPERPQEVRGAARHRGRHALLPDRSGDQPGRAAARLRATGRPAGHFQRLRSVFPQSRRDPRHPHRPAGSGRADPAECARHRPQPGPGTRRARAAGPVLRHRPAHLQQPARRLHQPDQPRAERRAGQSHRLGRECQCDRAFHRGGRSG